MNKPVDGEVDSVYFMCSYNAAFVTNLIVANGLISYIFGRTSMLK